MTRREALEIVLEAAERDLHGAGCGLRTIPQGKQREELVDAITKLRKELGQ